jgi:hypothetical protein
MSVILYRLENASVYCFVGVTEFSNRFQYRLEISVSGSPAAGFSVAGAGLCWSGGATETL